MTPHPAFLLPSLPASRPRLPSPLSRSPHPRRPRIAFSASSSSPDAPDAGLIAAPGVTGTICTNLWPAPVLGRYGCFLNVYDRSVAAEVGAFVVHAGPLQHHPITLSFAPGAAPATNDAGNSHSAFTGVAAGNLNVADMLGQLVGEPTSYMLKFFEKGGSEPFWSRRSEVHVEQHMRDEGDVVPDLWRDPAPTFRVVARASMYEVRQLYSGAGVQPRNTSKFEYFAMNLFPIPALANYSCFVCVWKQRDRTAPVAIDKVAGDVRLSFFDPLELPDGTEENSPPAIGSFAVKVFFGAVTDAIVASQHKALLVAIAASPSTRAVSDTAFRIVVDNRPGVITPNRRNELWVQVD